jgi:hemerythrin-like domain-containing protein
VADETTNCRGDFFSSLVQDHARFEVQLKALLNAADTLSRVESSAADLEVIVQTLGFFATEGARHEESEELVLFPRLRSRPEFKQILSALEFQHGMNRKEGEALSACVDRFEPGSGRELRRVAIRFAEMQRGHAFAEERALFPLAASVLSPEVVAELGRGSGERKHSGGSTNEKG